MKAKIQKIIDEAIELAEKLSKEAIELRNSTEGIFVNIQTRIIDEKKISMT